MPRIRQLDDRLISKIAAGEVVERPASVVKELLENALDAGATRLELELEGGGARRIRLADDGSGMDRDDALLAFDRHATSKIATFEELERVGTLGFRGEALASIAAVSKLELTTAERPGEGTRVRIEGGRVLTAEPAPRAKGTTIEVASLFWNVPARRKFLKSRETELRRAVEVVEGYALARPDVAFSLGHEGRLLIEAPPLASQAASAGARERIAQLFGPELARRLEEIPAEAAEGLAPGAFGFVGTPETAKRGRRSFVFVNRRLVRDRAVLAAFYRAVREEWRSDDFPALFLFLDLPPEEVDVNVHPQKAEVRFRDGGYVDRVGQLLRLTLARARGEEPAPLRTAHPHRAPLASGALGWEGLGGRNDATTEVRELSASDLSDVLFGSGGAIGADSRRSEGGWLEAKQDQDASQDESQDQGKGFHRGERQDEETAFASHVGPGALGARADAQSGSVAGAELVARPSTSASSVFPFNESFSVSSSSSSSSAAAASDREAGRIAMAAYAPLSRAVVPLSGRSGVARPFRLLGQYKGALVLLEGPDGLYLIDQHVAHERILYERVRRALEAESPAVQRFVSPMLLELARSEAMKLAELAPVLGELGFDVEELSGGSIALSGAPSALGPEAARALVATVATDREATPETLRRRLLDDFAASMACKAAVKMHHPMSAEKLEALVSELFRAENPYACPHGRPVVLTITDVDLERRFGRR